ncbi:MAG: hypothetical protein WCJ02_07400 [bacterium]
MNTKMRMTGRWMVAGLFAMGMMAQCVWAQEVGTADQKAGQKQNAVKPDGSVKLARPADPFVKGAKPSSPSVFKAEPTATSANAKAVTPEESQVQEPHVNVEINESLVFFPKAFIEALARNPGSPSEEDLIKAWREGKGRLMASHLTFGKSGKEVSIIGVLEHVYPSEFNVTDGGVPETTTISESVPETTSESTSEPVLVTSAVSVEKPIEKATAPATNTATKTVTKTKAMTVEKTVNTGKKIGGTADAYWAVEPQNFTMREIGFITRAVPAVDPASKSIDLKEILQYTVHENDREIGVVQSGFAGEPIRMVLPEFHSMVVEMQRVCSDGHTAVQGGILSSDGKEMGYFFRTPRIVKVSKDAQANENEKEIRQIETQQLLVYFPKALVETFARGSGSAAASSEQIIKAWRDGKGRLVASALSVSPSGQEIISKGVMEYTYPSEFQVSGGSLRNGDVRWMVEPQNFTMRETGFVSQFVMEIADAQTIDMTFKPQYVCRGADHKIDFAWSSGGKQQQVVQPEFYRQSVEFGGYVRSGQTIVTGGMLSADGEEMGYFLITPKIVTSQK